MIQLEMERERLQWSTGIQRIVSDSGQDWPLSKLASIFRSSVCSRTITTAGLLTPPSLTEGGVRRVTAPSPEHPSAPPHQLFSSALIASDHRVLGEGPGDKDLKGLGEVTPAMHLWEKISH